jgi:curli biogenesis system outer membrane secretion channel CsgG
MKLSHLSLVLLITVFSVPQIGQCQLFGPSFSACVLKAPTKRLENVRKIAILQFDNQSNFIIRKLGADFGDRLPDFMTAELIKDYRGAVESKIYMKKIPTNVFSVIERDQIDIILKEQGLSVSGAIDESKAVDIGKLLGVDAMILGSLSYNYEDETYTRDFKKKDGTVVITYYRNRKLNASASMKIVSVQTGEIIGTTNERETETDLASSKKGYPGTSAVKSPESLAEEAYKDIATKLVNYFAPYYQTTAINLQKVKFKDFKKDAKEANKLLQNGEIDKGYAIYKTIYEADSYNPIAAYNLGAIHEAVGNFKQAKKYYDIAYQLENDTKAFERASEEAQKYADMMADFEAVGIDIKPYSFDLSEKTLADEVEVRGSGSSRIPIFSSPDKNAKVLARVPGGVDLPIIEKMQGWYKVRMITGGEGYLLEKDGKEK